jgi:hypothetical protein
MIGMFYRFTLNIYFWKQTHVIVQNKMNYTKINTKQFTKTFSHYYGWKWKMGKTKRILELWVMKTEQNL